MRTLFVVLLATVGLVTLSDVAVAGSAPRVRIGDRLPDVEIARMNGGRVHLSELKGHLLALTFYSPYCEPCQRELPTLAHVVDRASHKTAAPELVVIVNDGSPPPALVEQIGSGALWLMDGDNRAKFALQPRLVPCTFLVDKDGIVRHINRGYGAGYEKRVERWLSAMTHKAT